MSSHITWGKPDASRCFLARSGLTLWRVNCARFLGDNFLVTGCMAYLLLSSVREHTFYQTNHLELLWVRHDFLAHLIELYRSQQTWALLTSAAFVHLKHTYLSKHTRNLSAASRTILLSGPAGISLLLFLIEMSLSCSISYHEYVSRAHRSNNTVRCSLICRALPTNAHQGFSSSFRVKTAHLRYNRVFTEGEWISSIIFPPLCCFVASLRWQPLNLSTDAEQIWLSHQRTGRPLNFCLSSGREPKAGFEIIECLNRCFSSM